MKSRLLPPSSHSGFTFLELILVIAIIAITLSLVSLRTGAFSFWSDKAFVRRLIETATLLHQQAVVDQTFYRMEFDFDANRYVVSAVRPEQTTDEDLISLSAEAGTLTLELASFLSPSYGSSYTLIPPPSMPSLAKPVDLPSGVAYEDIRSMRGKQLASEGGKTYLLFSPRGFSEFGVIHLRVRGDPFTILINPFTGLTETYSEYKDFEWTYGRQKKES